jgi:hypothetical protein
MQACPKTRFNAVWKILLAQFKSFVVDEAEAKLAAFVGPNDFFRAINCDLMGLDSAVKGTKTNEDAL